MLRFHQPYYNEYKAYASAGLGTTHPIPDRKGPFDTWIANFERWNRELGFSDLEDLRAKHNARYGQILTSVRQNQVADGLRDTASVATFVWRV